MTYADRATYDGDWIQNINQGFGVDRWHGGIKIYDGLWKNYKEHGI